LYIRILFLICIFVITPYQKQWEFLKGKFEAGQLSHAYLFFGQEGIGKKEFAKEFVKQLNCSYSKLRDCADLSMVEGGRGDCQNCKLIEKEQFPDLLTVKSMSSESSVKNEKDMMEIDVGQIREVNNFLSYKSYYGGHKAIIIDNAERMNREAQHSFLKTLEEPKGKTVIFLISSKPEALLPTIFSRCQTVAFFPIKQYAPSEVEQKLLQELLPVIHGELAIKFQYVKKTNPESATVVSILKVLQRYFRNMLLAKVGVVSLKAPHEEGNYPVEKIKKIMRLIETLHMQLSATNTNPKLALEILLLEL